MLLAIPIKMRRGGGDGGVDEICFSSGGSRAGQGWSNTGEMQEKESSNRVLRPGNPDTCKQSTIFSRLEWYGPLHPALLALLNRGQ